MYKIAWDIVRHDVFVPYHNKSKRCQVKIDVWQSKDHKNHYDNKKMRSNRHVMVNLAIKYAHVLNLQQYLPL